MYKVHNKNILKERRANLRNNSTKAEIILWNYLKSSQLEGRKFRRQHSINYYILDFYCPSEKLGIELDGDIHVLNNRTEYDEQRDKEILNLNIRVLRFKNDEIYNNLKEVLEKIKSCFKVKPPENLYS
jgi:very-short-patch-repair endonuclease